MSDTSQGPGWWQASDDRWYPPHLAPQMPAAPGAPTTYAPGWTPYGTTASSVNAGLATALRIVFWAMAAVSGLVGLLAAIGLIAFSAFRDDLSRSSYDTLRTTEGIIGIGGLLYGATALGLLVLVVIWSWQAHRTVTSLGAQLSWRIGWTIGAWVIPCASIVLPKMVIGTIEKAALSPRREGRVGARWDVRPTIPLSWVWWLAFVFSTIRVGVPYESNGFAQENAIEHGGVITSNYVLAMVAAGLSVVSALAGAAYFHRMSTRLTPEGLAAHRDH